MDINVDLEILNNIQPSFPMKYEMPTEKKEIHSRNVGFKSNLKTTDSSIMVLSMKKKRMLSHSFLNAEKIVGKRQKVPI